MENKESIQKVIQEVIDNPTQAFKSVYAFTAAGKVPADKKVLVATVAMGTMHLSFTEPTRFEAPDVEDVEWLLSNIETIGHMPEILFYLDPPGFEANWSHTMKLSYMNSPLLTAWMLQTFAGIQFNPVQFSHHVDDVDWMDVEIES